MAHTLATVSWGRRWSVANSYLLPAMNRDSLHVATGAHVNRVMNFVVRYFDLFLRGTAEWLGCRTCDQQVAGSNPGLSAVECNPGQFVNTRASVTKQYNLVPANGR